jgi:putative FmdB family regulatory protein
MPSFVYVCPDCSNSREIRRSIDEEEMLPICDICDRMMRRVFRFGITFKGSGFYTTDKNK